MSVRAGDDERGDNADLAPEVITADRFYVVYTCLFGINNMPEAEIRAHIEKVAKTVLEWL